VDFQLSYEAASNAGQQALTTQTISTSPTTTFSDTTGNMTYVAPPRQPEDFVTSMQKLSDATHVNQGFVSRSYDQAVQGYSNSNNSWFERGVNFVGATLMTPLMLAEEGTRGILNIPSEAFGAIPKASRAGTELGIAFDTSLPTDQRVIGGLGAIRDLAFAFTGLGGPATVFTPGVKIESPTSLVLDSKAVGADGAALVESEASALQRIAANNRAGSPWADLRQAYQQAKGQVDFAHIESDVVLNSSGGLQKAQGGHFSTSPLVDIIPGTESVGANGSIWAKVNLRGPDGNWYLKTNNKGFASLTPDSWSLAQAKGEMSQAFLGRTQLPNGSWMGTSSGVNFRFYAPTKNVPLWRGFPEYTP
jgi:hypothetical protein